tara:strand:- start:175 stop:291 length:117 start_codon:yes stop_codon:yes gene_type:complete
MHDYKLNKINNNLDAKLTKFSTKKNANDDSNKISKQVA